MDGWSKKGHPTINKGSLQGIYKPISQEGKLNRPNPACSAVKTPSVASVKAASRSKSRARKRRQSGEASASTVFSLDALIAREQNKRSRYLHSQKLTACTW